MVCIDCSDSLGQSLTEDELSAAMKIVDVDNSGVIEFDEFVDWWVNKVSETMILRSNS